MKQDGHQSPKWASAWHISYQKAAQEIPTTTQEQDEAVILVAHLKIAKGPGWSWRRVPGWRMWVRFQVRWMVRAIQACEGPHDHHLHFQSYTYGHEACRLRFIGNGWNRSWIPKSFTWAVQCFKVVTTINFVAAKYLFPESSSYSLYTKAPDLIQTCNKTSQGW